MEKLVTWFISPNKNNSAHISYAYNLSAIVLSTYTFEFIEFSQKPHEMAIRISPILQMRPLSSRKIEVICLRSICGKWESQVLTPYGPEP